MQAKMVAEGYRVEVIKNSVDILTDLEEIMNKTPDGSVTYLQVLYMGEWKRNILTSDKADFDSM